MADRTLEGFKAVEDSIDALLVAQAKSGDHPLDAPNNSKSNVDLPEGTRQILYVDKTVLLTSAHIPSSANPTPGTQSYIVCSGRPSPSSEVTSGVIRFVPRAEIRVPSYSKARKHIQLFVDLAYQPTVLTQLQQKNRYLWIGAFAGGHLYSDLHTSD